MAVKAEGAATSPESSETTIADDGSIDSLFDAMLLDEEDEKEPDAPAAKDEPEEDTLEEDASDEDTDPDSEDDEEQDDDADALLDEAEEPAAPKAKDISQELITVRPDGIEEKVTVAEAAQGYMRTKDYTKKTMVVADIKKEAEAARTEYTDLIGKWKTFLDQTLVTENRPDPKLREENPGEYAAQLAEWNELETQRKVAEGVLNEKQREEHATQAEAKQRFVESQYAVLVEKLPHWKDPDVAKREAKVIRQYALDIGFAEEDLAQLHFAPAILTLRKAALHDKQKSKAMKMIRPASPTKTLTPSAKSSKSAGGKTPPIKKLAARLRSSGSPDDYMSLLLASDTLNDLKN